MRHLVPREQHSRVFQQLAARAKGAPRSEWAGVGVAEGAAVTGH